MSNFNVLYTNQQNIEIVSFKQFTLAFKNIATFFQHCFPSVSLKIARNFKMELRKAHAEVSGENKQFTKLTNFNLAEITNKNFRNSHLP